MLHMATRTPRSEPPPPNDEGEQPTSKPNRKGKALHVWLKPKLRDLLDELAKRTRRSVTTEVTIALEKHLRDEGLLPPKGGN